MKNVLTTAELDLLNRIETLKETLQRVRDLHAPWGNGTLCSYCLDGWGNSEMYPCLTIKALGDTK